MQSLDNFKIINQDQGYGCGLIAVAHALQIPDFYTEKRLAKSEKGNNIIQLNDWLREDGINFEPGYIFVDLLQNTIPPIFLNFDDWKDDYHAALILDVVVKEGNKGSHLIGAHLYKDMTIDLFDGYKDKPIRTRLNRVCEYYYSFFGISSFIHIKTRKWHLFQNK